MMQIMGMLSAYEEHTRSTPFTLLPAFYSIVTMWPHGKSKVIILVTKNLFHTVDTIEEVSNTPRVVSTVTSGFASAVWVHDSDSSSGGGKGL
jgi:hypothetical protein